MAISNYTKSLVKENSEKGIPVQRPLFMEFPDDATSWQISYQYMFGPDVLVAPVLSTNVTSQNVYLPPGEWKFLWDNSTYHGPSTNIYPAPLGKPPVFYRTSSAYAATFDLIYKNFPIIPPPGPPPGRTASSFRPTIAQHNNCQTTVVTGTATSLTFSSFKVLIIAIGLVLSYMQ